MADAITGHQLENQRWQAVCRRDKDWDGSFVTAVLTTGIYCRPSCPARRPNRENVTFYDAPQQARSAGFRACKRCKPDQHGQSSHQDAIIEACRLIQSAGEEPDLSALAASAGLSPGHFQRVFKAEVGLSPKRYAMAVRKKRLRDGLKGTGDVTGAIYGAGYASASRAYADNPIQGLTPSQYSKGAKGETIRYASTGTSLGSILVAATDRGVCLVEFVDGRRPENALAAHFPSAELREAGKAMKEWVSDIVGRVDAPRAPRPGAASVPRDIKGTAFQERVWRALMEIPCGETVSYAGLARSIGHPGAARAVAGACASNRLAVVVPCHRVIRESGDISGYKWGAERKRKLLGRESGNG